MNRAGALAALERRLVLLAAMPFLLLPPVVVVYALDVYRGDPCTRTAVRLMITVPAASVLLLALPYLVLAMVIGKLDYAYRLRSRELSRIDWDAPPWRPAADVLRQAGIDPGLAPAFRVFSVEANLAIVHMPRSMPAWWQRQSDWTVRHQRLLLASSVVICGITFLISDARPGWLRWTGSPATTWVLAAATGALVPAAVAVLFKMYRLNIRSARFAAVIPVQWRALLRTAPEVAVPLFAHEWSHIMHRDAVRRRITVAYGGWHWFAVFMTAGGAFGAFNDYTSALILPGMIAVAVGLLVMRRVRRMVPLVQELRADAEAMAIAGAPALRTALARLPVASGNFRLQYRLAAMDEPVLARVTRSIRFWVWAGWAGYVLPTIACTIAAIWIRL